MYNDDVFTMNQFVYKTKCSTNLKLDRRRDILQLKYLWLKNHSSAENYDASSFSWYDDRVKQ